MKKKCQDEILAWPLVKDGVSLEIIQGDTWYTVHLSKKKALDLIAAVKLALRS